MVPVSVAASSPMATASTSLSPAEQSSSPKHVCSTAHDGAAEALPPAALVPATSPPIRLVEKRRAGTEPDLNLISAESPAAKTPGRLVDMEESTSKPPPRPFRQSTVGKEGTLPGRTTTASQVRTDPFETIASALATPRIELTEPSTRRTRSALSPEETLYRMAAATGSENWRSRPPFPQ